MEVYRAANIHDINASDLGLCSRHRHWTIGRIVSGAFELTAKVSDDTHPQGRRKESSRLQRRCNVQLSFVENVNQVEALSRSVIFDGAQILNCWSESQRLVSSPLSLECLSERRWVRDKVWAPSKLVIFDGAQIYTVLAWVRKNSIEPSEAYCARVPSEQHVICRFEV